MTLPTLAAAGAPGRMLNNVLVTGASGFIGGHLVAELARLGKSVVTVSRRQGFDLLRDALPLQGIEHVFHLAARTGVVEAWQEPVDYHWVNTHGSVRVLDQCRRHGCSLSYISAYVYGQPRRLPIDETAPVAANNPYAFSKLMAEEACRFYSTHFGVRTTLLRLFNIYGPGQSSRFLIPHIIHQVLDPQCPVIEVKDLEPRRDYVYVTDAVAAIIASAQAGPAAVFNVGSGQSYSVEDIVLAACAAAGVRKPYRAVGERRSNELLDVVADIRAIAAACGWQPGISLPQGLKRVLESYRPL